MISTPFSISNKDILDHNDAENRSGMGMAMKTIKAKAVPALRVAIADELITATGSSRISIEYELGLRFRPCYYTRSSNPCHRTAQASTDILPIAGSRQVFEKKPGLREDQPGHRLITVRWADCRAINIDTASVIGMMEVIPLLKMIVLLRKDPGWPERVRRNGPASAEISTSRIKFNDRRR